MTTQPVRRPLDGFRATELGGVDGPTDGQLLGRFIEERDEAALAALIRRLGPAVLGVCRRVIGDAHLAEDAFQATFLVLVRKATSIRNREQVGSWVFGVAYRVARRAGAARSRQLAKEQPVSVHTPTAPRSPESHDEVLAVLDEELARLPEHYGAAVLACDLEGRTRKDAAARLGIPDGTLSNRLAAARRMLARRLVRRGVALGAAALLQASAPLRVSAGLVETTTRFVAGPAPSGPAAALAEGELKMMILAKLKTLTAVVVLAAGALGTTAVGLLAASGDTPPTPRTGPVATSAPAARPADPPNPAAGPNVLLFSDGSRPTVLLGDSPQPAAGPNKLLFFRNGRLVLIDPDGKNAQAVTEDPGKFPPASLRIHSAWSSPDGKTVAYLAQPEGAEATRSRRLYLKGVDEKGAATDTGIDCLSAAWSPDGAEIAYSDFTDGWDMKPEATHGVLTVATRKATALRLPDDHIITDWSRDGKHLLTTCVAAKLTPTKVPAVRLHLMNRDGTEHKVLTDENLGCTDGRLSPDGKRVLYMSYVRPGNIRTELTVLDVATGQSTPVAGVPPDGWVRGYCWSPDGKRIAYTWHEAVPGTREELLKKVAESRLVVCDSDGTNAKTVVTEKAQAGVMTIGNVDWR
jgi:RNA polymerase sigma factor (sigma-70 family)